MPQQHSTISGHLTPTSPRHEDMRLDPSLNVMPEGPLGDLPTAVNEEVRKREHQVPEERPQETPFKTSIEGTPDTHLKVKPESNIREALRRIQRTREASREDAIASTQQFFAAVNDMNRGNTTEGPRVITSEDLIGMRMMYLLHLLLLLTPLQLSLKQRLQKQRPEVLELSYLMGLLLDLLLQLPVDRECGYNIFWKDKLMNLPKMIPIQQKVVEQKPLY